MYYTSNGDIRGFPKPKLRPWPLKAVLEKKYRWEEEQAEQFCSWLMPMLELIPEDRVTAAASAEHSFLTGGQVVEGLGEAGEGKSRTRQREADQEPAQKAKKLEFIYLFIKYSSGHKTKTRSKKSRSRIHHLSSAPLYTRVLVQSPLRPFDIFIRQNPR